jgi:hypothetical protein
VLAAELEAEPDAVTALQPGPADERPARVLVEECTGNGS